MDSNMKIESKAKTGTRNGVRSGADYIASLQDDRTFTTCSAIPPCRTR